MRATLLTCGMLAWLSLCGGRASAQLSPGELSRAHESLDSSRSCLECHATGKGITPQLCLSCHQVLGEQIEQGAGLHARPGYESCETCHIEHNGRDFELIWWGKAGIGAFDHAETGHTLTGAHQLECRQCHRASRIAEPQKLLAAGKDLDRTYLGLDSDCAACHQDPHRGQMEPRSCSECHGQTTWKPAAGFDHNQTRFPLDGRHGQAACAKCHAGETDDDGSSWIRYRGTATTCLDCHRDVHGARLGRDCASCHVSTSWQNVDRARFDHDLTRYPLRGRHARVDCAGCHQTGGYRVAEFTRCASCHADVHLGQFRDRPGGGACAECHDPGGFTPSRFDLADHRGTLFPLQGAHRSVPCASCHRAVPTATLVASGRAIATPRAPNTAQAFRLEADRCADCHLDPHAGTADAFLGDLGCEGCHDLEAWRSVPLASTLSEARFDHHGTGFALEGAHRVVACGECHEVTGRGTNEVRLSFQGAPTTCRGCHDDPHLRQFDRPERPAACRDCHSLEGWQPSLFRHNTSTFPLEGKHARAACGACHKPELAQGREVVRYRPLPTACSACHLPKEPSTQTP